MAFSDEGSFGNNSLFVADEYQVRSDNDWPNGKKANFLAEVFSLRK